MSYLVFARKYRPMKFEEVVGQSHVTTTLMNAINSLRIVQAYLFSGPRGTGKTTTARILAKALNCETGITAHPCNVCTSCTEINQSRSIDVFEMDAASKSRVDDIRELIIEGVKYAPVGGRYKVYIIDEVQMLSDNAFDALLKTIEEPPKNVVFIFATTEPHDIPETIISRCQRFDFRRVPFDLMVKDIIEIAQKENVPIEKEVAFFLASKAEGSLRDARSLLEQVIAYGGEKIDKKLVDQILGLVDQELFFELTSIISEKDIKKGLIFVDRLFNSGIDVNEFVTGFLQHLRNLLLAKSGIDSEEIFNLSSSYIERYQADSGGFSETDILRMIKISADLVNNIKKTSEPRVFLETAVIKLIRLDSSIFLEDLIQRLDNLQSQNPQSKNPTCLNQKQEGKSSATPKETEPNSDREIKNLSSTSLGKEINFSAAAVDIDFVKEKWGEVLNRVKKEKASLGTFLCEGELVNCSDNELTVEFHNGRQFHKKQVEKRDSLSILEKVLKEIFNSPLRLKFTLDQTKEKPLNHERDQKNAKKNLMELAQEKPELKSLLEHFDGEIIS
jgi:DNA polymerase-3 subunit gamma/tau